MLDENGSHPEVGGEVLIGGQLGDRLELIGHVDGLGGTDSVEGSARSGLDHNGEFVSRARGHRSSSRTSVLSSGRLHDHPACVAMCRLHDEGRDHIWGYYVRNLARPIWLSTPGNRVDVMIGNPPWLAYRYMTEEMQETFRSMSEERGLWHGATVATHQDLSGLFLARANELYLRNGGRFGLVMPHAALSRRHFSGLRTGKYPAPAEPITVEFDTPWDMHAIKPTFFPVPCSVFFGKRTPGTSRSLPEESEAWGGRLPQTNVSWAVAEPLLSSSTQSSAAATDVYLSPYRERFAQGATIVPRMLMTVEEATGGPLGAGAGRRSIRSQRSPNEKKPWKHLPSLEGNVETQFVRKLYFGENMVSYRLLQPRLAVIPWDGAQLLNGSSEQIDLYPGLAGWWREAEKVWLENRSSARMTLLERLDYRRGLSDQFPVAEHRIVYTKSGMYLAAARISDPTIVIDHKLYWAAATSETEALYLCAVLNSPVLTEAVQPLQARGEHNPRDFDKYVWQLPIPAFDASEEIHTEIASLAIDAEQIAAATDLDLTKRFQTSRRLIREVIARNTIGKRIDHLVQRLLQ